MAMLVPKRTKQHNLNSLFKFDLAVLSASWFLEVATVWN